MVDRITNYRNKLYLLIDLTIRNHAVDFINNLKCSKFHTKICLSNCLGFVPNFNFFKFNLLYGLL